MQGTQRGLMEVSACICVVIRYPSFLDFLVSFFLVFQYGNTSRYREEGGGVGIPRF